MISREVKREICVGIQFWSEPWKVVLLDRFEALYDAVC